LKRNILTRSIALALPVVFCVASCATVSDVGQSFSRVFGGGDGKGPGEVDDLLGRIERVYVECELSQQSSRAALEALQTLTSPDFRGDPVSAYAVFAQAVIDSDKQSAKLTTSIGPMKKSAEPFFDQWASDLSMYSSMDMRLHSQNRLTETRERYDAILVALEPAAMAYEVFNETLSDHVLFLTHDFNAGAVSSIEGEVVALTEHTQELDSLFVEARDAAQAYVRSAALRGQIDVAPGRASGIDR
jgi:hypothetical protein